jgi:hypothetical protein
MRPELIKIKEVIHWQRWSWFSEGAGRIGRPPPVVFFLRLYVVRVAGKEI